VNSILKELPEGSRKLIIEEYIFILYLPLKWVGLMGSGKVLQGGSIQLL